MHSTRNAETAALSSTRRPFVSRLIRTRAAALVGAVTAAIVVAGVVPSGAVVAATTTAPVPSSDYTLLGAGSETSHPNDDDKDGTAKVAFDGDFDSQWTVANEDGEATEELPHWLAIDTGESRTLSGINYSVKPQPTGPVKGYEVYVSDDDGVVQEADSADAGDAASDAWGEPVASGKLEKPESADERQEIPFDAPVDGRYVKFVATSVYGDSGIASISELQVLEEVEDAGDEPSGSTDVDTTQLSNGKGLTVNVGNDFPQIVSYSLDGAEVGGQAEKLDTFRINGEDYSAATEMKSADDKATYTSTLDGFDATITSRIQVTDSGDVVFTIDDITGGSEADVDEISIPNNSFLSVTSGDTGANLARTKIDTDSTTTADNFIDIDGDAKVDEKPVSSPYAFVGTEAVSAGILTNATDDSKQDNNDNWNTRLSTQVVDAGQGARRAEVSVGNWTWAPAGATDERVTHYERPRATIVLAGDRNDSGDVTWQDAAIAYRDAADPRQGADRVPERVAMRIPFNFGSQASNPFLKTLDNTKRISMATDDLGQFVLDKGYASEGHDSAHPDYANHINERAGGEKDFNTMLDDSSDYNTDVYVHVNATEAYAGARSFSDRLIKGQGLGWDWLNQAYHIDQRHDLGSGNILDRFQGLADEAPGLDGVYIDAYYSSGWLADALADNLNDMGLEVATEWAYKFVGTSTWSHWANDKAYGGKTNKGINSDIARFIFNGDADVWNTDPVLGGAEIKDFEGWTGNDDWNTFYDTIWQQNLPTKFLQHFDLTSWTDKESATFTDGVNVKMDGDTRVITMGDAEVLRGDDYLLPWQSVDSSDDAGDPTDADKMYFYSASGGEKTFGLTDQFSDDGTFDLYTLTDQGRQKAGTVTASGRKVTIDGKKGTPYVLVPQGGTAPHAEADYGAGSGLTDPGFNSGSADDWNSKGDVEVTRTKKGDNVLSFGSSESSVAQKVTGLTAGKTYRFSTALEIEPGHTRSAGVAVSGDGVDVQNAVQTTPVENTVSGESKHGSNTQRVGVDFTAPADGTVMVSASAAKGAADVTIDDARILQVRDLPIEGEEPVGSAPEKAGDNELVYDFEDNVPGWGPFVKGDAGNVTDPRTSISELHAPYTQKEWKSEHAPFDSGDNKGKATDDVIDGLHSLKSHEENDGLVYRTTPASVPFQSGHKYRVSFDYQSSEKGPWRWVRGTDTVADGETTSTQLDSTTMGAVRDTDTFTDEFVAGCGDETWVGLRKKGGSQASDFVLDNFRVTDLGEADGGATCATVDTEGSTSFNPGAANEFTTTFTNNEDVTAENVALSLSGVPDDWTVQVKEKEGNLFDKVKPGETVKTVWLITPPAPDDSEGSEADAAQAAPAALAAASDDADSDEAGTDEAKVTVTAEYLADCVEKSVDTDVTFTLNERAVVGVDEVTADSEQSKSGAEGPAANVLDGKTGTLWHTEYSPETTEYPHWIQFDLGETAHVDGIGYQQRASGPNGNVKDYTVSVSDDGDDWTEVASGSLKDERAMQQIDFEAVDTRYVKFTALNAHNGQSFAAASEMRIYGSGGTEADGYEPAARPESPDCTPSEPGDGSDGGDSDGDGSGNGGSGSDGSGGNDSGSNGAGNNGAGGDSAGSGSSDGTSADDGSSFGQDASSQLPDRDLPWTGAQIPWAAGVIALLLVLGGAVTWLVGRRRGRHATGTE